jgi:putative NADH-flavin reductase
LSRRFVGFSTWRRQSAAPKRVLSDADDNLSVILKELVDRGHTIVAAARTPEKVQKLKNVTAVLDDLSNPAKTASIVKGADAVVSAYGPPPDDASQIIGATDRLVKGIKQAGGPRLIVVGGAGSLFVAPGVTVRESGHLPKELIPIVDAHIQVLRNLKQSSIDWTYFSPTNSRTPSTAGAASPLATKPPQSPSHWLFACGYKRSCTDAAETHPSD